MICILEAAVVCGNKSQGYAMPFDIPCIHDNHVQTAFYVSHTSCVRRNLFYCMQMVHTLELVNVDRLFQHHNDTISVQDHVQDSTLVIPSSYLFSGARIYQAQASLGSTGGVIIVVSGRCDRTPMNQRRQDQRERFKLQLPQQLSILA